MPLGIVSDEEFDRQIREVPSLSDGVIKPIIKGRGEGNVQVPDMLRKIIGENAVEEGNQATKVLTDFLGISDSSMTAYKKGATSTTTYDNPTPTLGSHIAKTKQRIAKRASNKLGLALSKITDEKLDAAKAIELSSIAKNLSGIIKDMEPDDTGRRDPSNGPSIVIFAPQMAKEEVYDVIDVSTEP